MQVIVVLFSGEVIAVERIRENETADQAYERAMAREPLPANVANDDPELGFEEFHLDE